MNIKKIKLGLSVRFMNLEAENLIQGVQEAMQDFFSEVGHFIEMDLLGDHRLNTSYMHREYVLHYEHVTLHVELVNNPFTATQSIQNFSLKDTGRLAA